LSFTPPASACRFARSYAPTPTANRSTSGYRASSCAIAASVAAASDGAPSVMVTTAVATPDALRHPVGGVAVSTSSLPISRFRARSVAVDPPSCCRGMARSAFCTATGVVYARKSNCTAAVESKLTAATRDSSEPGPTPLFSAPTIDAAKSSISPLSVSLIDPDVSITNTRSTGTNTHVCPSSVVGDKVVTGDKVVGDTLAGEALVGDTLAGDAVVGDTLAGDTLAGDTVDASGEQNRLRTNCR